MKMTTTLSLPIVPAIVTVMIKFNLYSPPGMEASYAPNTLTSNNMPDGNGCVAMDTGDGGSWKVYPCSLAPYNIPLPFVCQFGEFKSATVFLWLHTTFLCLSFVSLVS